VAGNAVKADIKASAAANCAGQAGSIGVSGRSVVSLRAGNACSVGEVIIRLASETDGTVVV
jgi:hypothetical protein